jgi:hypothetical protein
MKLHFQTKANLNTANAGALCERSHPDPLGIEYMRVSGRIVLFALFCLLCSVAAQAAGEYMPVEVESLRIVIDNEWCSQLAPGYWPVRVDITNLGNDRVIELHGQGSRWWNMGESGQLEIRQSIRLKRSDHVKLTIPVPVFADNEGLQVQIRERGRILTGLNYDGLQSNKPQNQTGALIIADPATPFGSIASGLSRPLPTPIGMPPGSPVPNLDFVLDPTRLPSNWLGLTSVSAIFIGPKEWEKLAEPQKEALLAWTASGGDFMYVDGDLSTLLPDPRTRPARLALNEGNQTPYYFGRIHLLNSEELRAKGLDAALSPENIKAESEHYALPANRSLDWIKFPKDGYRLPIPGIGGVPVRSYLAILVAFSVLIGPVNFIWLRRKRRQILLVLTAPLISVTFILLLSGYVFLGEGFDVTVRAESLTMLDQKTNRAATRATVSMYAAGMAPSNGLRFSRDTAIFPRTGGFFAIPGRSSERQAIDLTDAQQFTTGIAKVRAPSNFEEISFRPARARLSFNHADGGITVVNGLGATITRLFYRDAGKVFMLDLPLKTGAKAAMRVADESSLNVLPAKFHFLREIQSQPDHTYIAWLESSPFLETGAPDVKERGSLHLVMGFVGEEQ